MHGRRVGRSLAARTPGMGGQGIQTDRQTQTGMGGQEGDGQGRAGRNIRQCI